MAFILHLCSPCDETFHTVPFIVPRILTFKFNQLMNNFKHGFYSVMVAAQRASISLTTLIYLLILALTYDLKGHRHDR